MKTQLLKFNFLLIAMALLCLTLPAASASGVIPTPQYFEPIGHSIAVLRNGSVGIFLAPRDAAGKEKLKLAAAFLDQKLKQIDPAVQVKVGSRTGSKESGTNIYLWDYGTDPNPPLVLNFLDRQVLANRSRYGQSYVIRTTNERTVWVVGSTDEGVLLGTMSLLQLIQRTADGLQITATYIRDYPDFQYRAAADWLLNVEINRWALDWGQGIEAYKQLCERKIDQALRYKINMIVFDGFGWGLKQRFPGYGALMRSLNQYARARGIRLLYGGYGASYGIAYQSGPLYEAGAYMGQIFKNRESYPDGPIYECMGFPHARNGIDTRTLGSCRANEALNRLKGDELRKFVETIEPGALYIHHEDFGGYRGTEAAWQQRCSRCRRKWPNNSLKAPDGGAGGLANGYSALIRAVNSVHNSDGYDASRDCLIILVSPVYDADSPSSADWSNVLALWKNIGLQLPRADNIQVCFREIFPQRYGGRPWIHAFDSTMKSAGLKIGSYVFFAGGADNYITDYPLTGASVLNSVFQGATGIYNASGDFYEEPMEIINAEYEWNTHSAFYRDPKTYQKATDLWKRFAFSKDDPKELFDRGGLYERSCDLLYGAKAGPIMAKYYQESEWVPDTITETIEVREQPAKAESDYLPMMWDRVYAVPEQWRDLAVDSKTWGVSINDHAYSEHLARLHVDLKELHRRLARHWALKAELNSIGAKEVREAIEADPRPGSVPGLEFLEASFRVDQPLLEALTDFHHGMEQYATSRESGAGKADFERALKEATEAEDLAARSFPHPVDPVGGEVGALRTFSRTLIKSIKQQLQ